jgi:hypothetical protein
MSFKVDWEESLHFHEARINKINMLIDGLLDFSNDNIIGTTELSIVLGNLIIARKSTERLAANAKYWLKLGGTNERLD